MWCVLLSILHLFNSSLNYMVFCLSWKTCKAFVCFYFYILVCIEFSRLEKQINCFIHSILLKPSRINSCKAMKKRFFKSSCEILILFTRRLWTKWCFSCFEFSFQGSFKYVSVRQYGKHPPYHCTKSKSVHWKLRDCLIDHRITMCWYKVLWFL